MSDEHIMETETELKHGWLVQCPECLLRMFVGRDGDMEVMDRGDLSVSHSWSSTPEISLSVNVAADIGDTK